MKEQPQMGLNRTGIQMSPFEASEMQSGLTSIVPGTPGDDAALVQVRSEYAVNADPLGSVPIPGSVEGVAADAAATLTGKNPRLFLDKMGERLAFERTSTRLYDALITKFDALQDSDMSSMSMDELQKIREDEARHFSILVGAMEAMGADPTAQTPCADLVGIESMGLVQVLTDPRTSIAQCLHAILLGEMADQNGWEMLITLAEENHQSSLLSDFTVALDEERTHLQQVQKWYEEATFGMSYSDEATGQDELPSQLH